MSKKELEQTLVLIKPDAMKNSLTGYVLSQLSEFHTGLRFAAAKVVNVTQMLAEEHYAEHKGKLFFPSLLDYIMGRIHYPNDPWKRRVMAFIYQGEDAIQKIRNLAGPTNPHIARDTKPGCVRSLGTIVPIKDAAGNVIEDRLDNLLHASANPADAEREIKLWFKPIDIPPLMQPYPTTVATEHYYYKEGKLYTKYEDGSFGFIAPGDVIWKSDFETLQNILAGKETTDTLEYVVAKYLINLKSEGL